MIDRIVKWWMMRNVPKYGPYYARKLERGFSIESFREVRSLTGFRKGGLVLWEDGSPAGVALNDVCKDYYCCIQTKTGGSDEQH